jgi:Methyltransferase TRM13
MCSVVSCVTMHLDHPACRGLRHLDLLRLRIGIEDLWLPGLELFSSNGADSAHGGTQASGENGIRTTCSSESMSGSSPDLQHRTAPSTDDSRPSSCHAGNGCKEGGSGVSQIDSRHPWVALGKHLCGAASDFTLRCTMDSMQTRTGSVPSRPQWHCLHVLHAGSGQSDVFSMSSEWRC